MRLATLAAVTAALGASPSSAQGTAESYGFLLLVGNDTVGVERVMVWRDRWTGDITVRNQGRVVWSAPVVAPGKLGSLDLSAFRTERDSAPFQVVTLAVDGDSVRMTTTVPAPSARAFATKVGAMLLVNSSVAMTELYVRQIAPGASVSVPTFLTMGGQTLDVDVRRGKDSASVSIGGQLTQLAIDGAGRVLEGRNAAQGLRFVRLDGAQLGRVTLGAPNYDAPEGAPYTAEHVRIPVGGTHELAATLTKPRDAAGRVPAVVTISGSGAQDRDESLPVVRGFRPFRQVADTLGRRGVAVLRFDDRGFGGSTGNSATASSADFAKDVSAIVAWLRARPDIDPARIVLLGHSEGGMIAPMVAADDARLAGIVLLAGPSRNGRDIILYQQRYVIERDSTLATPGARDSAAARARAQFDSAARTQPWLRFFVSHDPLATARRSRVPALVLAGGSDRQVTADQAEELGAALRASGNRDVTVRVFSDLNRLFLHDPDGNPQKYSQLPSGRIGGDVMGLIADWVVSRTMPGTRPSSPAVPNLRHVRER